MTAFPCGIAATPHAESVLRELDASGVIVADHRFVEAGRIHLTLGDAEIAALEARGLTVERGERLGLRSERTDVGDPLSSTGPVDLLSGFVTGYLDHNEIAARVATLAATFPTLCTLTTLPSPTSGYDGALAAAAGPANVQMLRITTAPLSRSKPAFLLIGGTHAREWMNPLIALEFAEQLLRNYDPTSVDPDVEAISHIVSAGDILVIPVLNPDGLNFSVHDDAGWRKNRRPNVGSAGCPGVDNNRNYEVYFGGAGASASACSDSYHGPSAFSEAENRNLQWVLEQFPNVLVGVDAHSFGQQILRPGPAGGSFIPSLPVSAADHAVYTTLEAALGNAITAVNGAVYSTGSTSNHAGTSDEYMFFAHRVFGFNTECGSDFQPPWAIATTVIDEMVAGLRALATATVDLVTTTTAPLSVVQCIDRTGSMVAFGYEASARANAKRFVDMLSLGDSTAVVSFADPSPDPLSTPEADRAQVEVPMTLLDDPGDAAPIRAAVDAIAFGGWTPIGAGLKASAAMLTGAPAPNAVLLLSDGYENRTPTVASALATLPAGLRVFTVALGPAADAALLQQVATHTGGDFHLSPTALDLHQIYNDMRADITDEGLALNTLVAAGDEADAIVDVEPAADRLTVSVSTEAKGKPVVGLIAPSGRVVRADDHGVRASSGDGYRLVAVDRPAPGRWRIRTTKARSARIVAAFVASPLRVELELPPVVKAGEKIAVRLRGSFDDQHLAPLRATIRSHTIGQVALPRKGQDPVDPDRAGPSSLVVRAPKLGPVIQWTDRSIDALPAGFSRVQLELSGELPGGAVFHRVATRTVCVVA